MNKIFLFSIGLVLSTMGLAACSKTSPASPIQSDASVKVEEVIKTTSETIAGEFSKKYQKSVDTLMIETEVDTGLFAKGSVRFKDELGGGLWFGVKTSKGWELAHDGQGPMSCEIANKYQFPADIVPGCIDTQNGNTFVQR